MKIKENFNDDYGRRTSSLSLLIKDHTTDVKVAREILGIKAQTAERLDNGPVKIAMCRECDERKEMQAFVRSILEDKAFELRHLDNFRAVRDICTVHGNVWQVLADCDQRQVLEIGTAR